MENGELFKKLIVLDALGRRGAWGAGAAFERRSRSD